MAKSNGNGVETISEKPIDQMSYKEVWQILLKRLIALPSKFIGFKPACLAIATYLLLSTDKFPWWGWFATFVVVLFGREGLKMIVGMKNGWTK